MKNIYCLVVMIMATLLNAQDYNRKLDNFLASEIGKLNIPNVDIAVISGNNVVYSKSIGEKQSDDALYYIGSVSKSLTALGILKLVDSGKLDVEQTLSEIIPTIQYNDDSRQITIRHLLNHTSGISKRSGFRDLPNLNALENANFSLTISRKPGKIHEYSNLNYALLGLVIEQISGVAYSDFMASNVFQPLHMNSSVIYPHRQENDRIIEQYQYWGGFPVNSKQVDYATTAVPAGFILSNTGDLSNYLSMMLSNGQFNAEPFIDPRLISEMLTPWDKSGYGYAMGWKKGAYHGKTTFQHLGSTATSYAAIFIIPEKNIGFSILTNTNSLIFTEKLTEGILNILTDGTAGPVSDTEFYLRIVVLIGILFFTINLLIKIIKELRNTESLDIKKMYLSSFINIGIFILFAVIFPYITDVPLLTFLKLQPDIGTLILLYFLSPLILNTVRVIHQYASGK